MESDTWDTWFIGGAGCSKRPDDALCVVAEIPAQRFTREPLHLALLWSVEQLEQVVDKRRRLDLFREIARQ
jgi:hypothetical protein